MTLNAKTDQAVFNQMLATALGETGPKVWAAKWRGFITAVTGGVDPGKDADFTVGFKAGLTLRTPDGWGDPAQ